MRQFRAKIKKGILRRGSHRRTCGKTQLFHRVRTGLALEFPGELRRLGDPPEGHDGIQFIQVPLRKFRVLQELF